PPPSRGRRFWTFYGVIKSTSRSNTESEAYWYMAQQPVAFASSIPYEGKIIEKTLSIQYGKCAKRTETYCLSV
ncbi:MAG: hypothetical protein Q7J01_03845, partial [Syntrophales bacterium]|nr:hypothetical protein [Syntrophales bacterium]